MNFHYWVQAQGPKPGDLCACCGTVPYEVMDNHKVKIRPRRTDKREPEG